MPIKNAFKTISERANEIAQTGYGSLVIQKNDVEVAAVNQ